MSRVSRTFAFELYDAACSGGVLVFALDDDERGILREVFMNASLKAKREIAKYRAKNWVDPRQLSLTDDAQV